MAARIALFDLGRVVLDWEPERLYKTIFDDAQEREMFLRDICNMDWHTRHDAGVSFAENAKPLIEKYPQYEDAIHAWSRRWMDMFNGYIEGTVPLIERLAAKGVPLHALSNMPSETVSLMFEHFPVMEMFDKLVISGDIGMVKPNEDIFLHTLETLGGVAAAEVFFTDDSPKNIDAAGALGFRTHLFESAAGLEQALLAEGLL